MNRPKIQAAAVALALMLSSCASFNSFQNARAAEKAKDWDRAVVEYEKALEIDPDNRKFEIALARAKREASRAHFEKGKSLFAAAETAQTSTDKLNLAQLAATELHLTVKLDPTNQFAVVQLSKAVSLINEIEQAASQQVSIDEIKRRAQSEITKAHPPALDPTSNEPITLTFSRDTPVKDIYRALGNAFGINILFDQAVKDDRISIELRDVSAQQALERVMQAANHFYKVLDAKTIIVIPDNAQSRRDYEDLVIRTFYLSNGDAEQVTNVVRTMIEARNVFPLKALNAITIRDTADKVRIAEKIIEANDKAKAEVVVQVELVQMDLSKFRDLGFAVTGISQGAVTPVRLDAAGNPVLVDGKTVPFTGGTLADLAQNLGDINALRNGLNFVVPAATYSFLKTLGNSELLANPELRISEGEKATLHIGQQIPVPTTTIAAYNPTQGNQNNTLNPYGSTSFNYRDVGIKVAMEPRVHHNREVTLKLTVEVSNRGTDVEFAGQRQPTFATRTIESTIRLKDGETNFLAGLIQSNKVRSETKTPILGDLPFIGRLFTNEHREETRTDLVLTMTPHIIRIPDITAEDLAPMWVGTGSNLTFRGMTPRIEAQGTNGDPFVPGRSEEQFNAPPPAPAPAATTPAPNPYMPGQGTLPTDPFRRQQPQQPQPPPPEPPGNNPPNAAEQPPVTQMAFFDSGTGELALAPRLAVQPATITVGAGEARLWKVVGMDVDGLNAASLQFRFDPQAINVMDIVFGPGLAVDPAAPPAVYVDRENGTITIGSIDAAPLQFAGGGEILAIRVSGGISGETFLVMETPALHDAAGANVFAAVTGGRARVE